VTAVADVRVLVTDRGNRDALTRLVERAGHAAVPADADPDLYVVEDHALPEYREALREEGVRRAPEFCPVLLVRRPETRLDLPAVAATAAAADDREGDGEADSDGGAGDGSAPSPEVASPRVVDETVTAPVDAPVFFRRVSNLLARQRHTRELAERNERLETFASTVAHEIRNPLNVATGRLELAREAGGDRHFDAVSRELERIDRLVDDVLTLARTGDVTVDASPVELSSVAAACWRAVDAPEATLDVAADRDVVADEDRLTQLLANLLRNAVEHGGRDVTVTVGDLDGGFYVADDGPGIPDAEREAVLETGAAGDDASTGLGLAVVKQVAAAHGWTVGVTDSEHGGARFEFRSVERPAATDAAVASPE
jgi:signal transduction histidine kinase